MKQIKELFKSTDIKQIKKLLEEIIEKIENVKRPEQNKLLEEFADEARKRDIELKNKCKIADGVYYYSENIAPITLLAEEIANDAEIEKDLLKILRFNLNNYFKQFKQAKKGDWFVDIEQLERIIQILELECKYFTMLKKNNETLSIFSFNVRFKNTKMEVLNYDSVNNSKFAIHSYHCKEAPAEEMSEVCFKQFGFLLNEILVGGSQRVPDGFLELFKNIDLEIDDESKEATDLFATTFAHYIIEKMEMRITNELGPNWKEYPDSRDEEFVKNMMKYFDDIFENLLEEREEFNDEDICACGSGKKYKDCCKKRKIKYFKSKEKGKFIKDIPMHPEVKPILRKEKIKFKKLFGRMPGGNDYIVGGVLLKDYHRMNKLIKRHGEIDKAWLYASDKMGFMLTGENIDSFPERDVNQFNKYVEEYRKIMNSKIKNNLWNVLQAIEAVSFIIESLLDKTLEDMVYVLNLFVNSYSKEKQSQDKFIIQNIKDFLVFCAYKTSINLNALKQLVNEEYYDNAMCVVRNIFEILISMKAYKNDAKLFEDKILPVAGLDLGTHRRVEKSRKIEEIATGKICNYEVTKKRLAEIAGDNYMELYRTLYRELSEFIHLDAVAAKNIFQENDMFEDIDECLIAGFIGMIFSLEIIMELIEFEGADNRVSKDIQYFSNFLIKDFLPVIETIIDIDDKEVYHILEDTLKDYDINYKINLQRNKKCEVF